MPPPPLARPLVVSADEELIDDLLRLLAAAGTEPELATGGPALRRAHRDAPLVLLGADALSGGAVRALPRRPGVVVVSGRPLPATGWAAAVEVGAERVAVLPEDEAWLLSRSAAAAQHPADRGWLVAVGGSCGGAGVSTVAAATALAAAPGVVLVDADPWGAGLDLLLGAERVEGLRWPELGGLRGRVDGDALMAALPEVGGVHVLAASRSAPAPVPDEALTAAVEAVRAVGRPVVVDLPARRAGHRGGAGRCRPRRPGGPGPAACRHGRAAAGRGAGLGLVGGPAGRPLGGRRPVTGRGGRRRGSAGPGRAAARPECRAAR